MRSALISLVVVALGAAALVFVFDVPLNDPVWWLSNDAPPRLVVDGPHGPLRGEVEGHISLEPAGRVRIVSVRVDDQPRTTLDGRVAIDTSSLHDGPHRVEVVAHDTSRRQNLGSAAWTFVSDNTPPKLSVTLDPSEGPLEGHTLLLRVQADEPLQDVRGTINSRGLRLQADASGGFWIVQGIPPDPPETTFSINLAATDLVGNPVQVRRDWPIRRTTFPEDDLVMQPSQAELDAHAAEDRQLADVYRRANGPKQWDGPFRTPVGGDVTTAFGTHRSYEFHPGTDFAAAQGTPVIAPATGVVVLVAMLPARGNVVIVDHGAGVYSTYAHLQKAEVEQGMQVKPGQVLGRVGTTGFSTGPHLHWEIWVDGANVDPLDWTRRAFP